MKSNKYWHFASSNCRYSLVLLISNIDVYACTAVYVNVSVPYAFVHQLPVP